MQNKFYEQIKDDWRLADLVTIKYHYDTLAEELKNASDKEEFRKTSKSHILERDRYLGMHHIINQIVESLEGILKLSYIITDKDGNFNPAALQYFSPFSDEVYLKKMMILMSEEHYRNLEYINNANDEYSIIRAPLYFLNVCFDDFFRYISRQLRFKGVDKAWRSWTKYKEYCSSHGWWNPSRGCLDFEITTTTDKLYKQMLDSFDDVANHNETSDVPITRIAHVYKDTSRKIDSMHQKICNIENTTLRIDRRTRTAAQAKNELNTRREGENICLQYWNDYNQGRLGDRTSNTRHSHKDLLKFPRIKADLAKYGICTENDVKRAIKNALRRMKVESVQI